MTQTEIVLLGSIMGAGIVLAVVATGLYCNEIRGCWVVFWIGIGLMIIGAGLLRLFDEL